MNLPSTVPSASLVAAVFLSAATTNSAPAGDPAPIREAIRRMNEGIGLLEQYRYQDAYDVFSRLVRAHPAWPAAHVNLGLAAFNRQEKRYLEEAERSFRKVLLLEGETPHALVPLAVLLRHLERNPEALEVLERAAKADPADAHILFLLGSTRENLGQQQKAIEALREAVRLQPSFASALYRLGMIYARGGKEERTRRVELLHAFQALENQQSGIKSGVKYGEAGKYSLAWRGTAPPGSGGRVAAEEPPAPPRFGPAKAFAPPARVQRRPGGQPMTPALALADLSGDGTLEAVLCGVETPNGPRTVIYAPDAGGMKVRQELPFDALVCAAGDLDGDGQVDLVAAGQGWLKALAGDGKGGFKELPLGLDAAVWKDCFPLRLYLLDLDSDGDLDLASLWERKEGERITSGLLLHNNNRDGTYRDITGECGLTNLPPAVELAFADWDGDVDLDLLLIEAGGRPRFFANDRVWRYRPIPPESAPQAPGVITTCGGDFDGDGAQDLVLFCGDRLRWWKNAGDFRFREDPEFTRRHGGLGSGAGVVFDFWNSLEPALLVLDARTAEGKTERRPVLISNLASEGTLAPDLGAGAPEAGASGGAAALFTPAGPPQILIYDTVRGARLHDLASPGTWLALDLQGPGLSKARGIERSNACGMGATVEVRAGRRASVWQLTTGTGGTVRLPPRISSGLAGQSSAEYARILWPDGILQSELGLAAGRLHRLVELERKDTSCPVLFAWDGGEFRFVADFLGAGGLGYLERPGVYARPDPTEIVPIPRLEPMPETPGAPGEFQLRLLEPLEECTYLDQASLLVVDHPPEVTVLPLELFAVKAPPPGLELLAFRERQLPVRAIDHRGEDVTEALLREDGRYAPRLERDPRFKGFLREPHAIELDFGEGIGKVLGSLPATGPARPVLFLRGYIEYPTSTSTFAAWQAGITGRAPSFLVERDGPRLPPSVPPRGRQWVMLREEWGFPAGYPRWMAVDLEGLLRPSDRRMRIETNLEIAWDQACLALAEPADPRWIREISASKAELRFRGFPADPPPGEEVEGFLYRDFLPWEHYRVMPGSYTRYGDVRELLAAADDRFAIFGPGEEVALAFPASEVGGPPGDTRRAFFFRCAGYCKDLDLYTAGPGTVEPLPFAAMKGYSAGGREDPPAGPASGHSDARWNTRVISGGSRTPISTLRQGE